MRPDNEQYLSITDLVNLPIAELRKQFDKIVLDSTEEQISKRLLKEIKSRLIFLDNVGLGYLTLNRESRTLSGGESQRINLATSLGSTLVGSLYVLDEPSIGLHSRDTQQLLSVLKNLRDEGNTVVVVEHDTEVIASSDILIDMGPNAGVDGGEVVFSGKYADATDGDIEKSLTLKYIFGKEKIEIPKKRRKWKNSIKLSNLSNNNLKNIDVKFPLGILTVVTGVSGSGKSTLVKDCLFAELQKYILSDKTNVPNKLSGNLNLINAVEFVNQQPIGKSTRSNPATYLKAFDEIRKLFSETQLAKQMGFSPAFFSFNQDGGRCDNCNGDGVITVPMQFMADVQLECEVCFGKRFKKDILEARVRDKNIFDVLELTVDAAIDFFGESASASEKRIVKRLLPLKEVGLGYIKLGQPSSTLSGGENQRVKLASFLVSEQEKQMFFIFDEPSTGLHTDDIKTLMRALNAIVERGHTVVIIEHNLDIIAQSDYIIDLGPEGGPKGGNVVSKGTPEEVAQDTNSITGFFLKNFIDDKQKQ